MNDYYTCYPCHRNEYKNMNVVRHSHYIDWPLSISGYTNRRYSSGVQFWIKAESDPLSVHKKRRPDRSRLLLHARYTTLKFVESRTRHGEMLICKKKKKSWASWDKLLKNTWAVLLFCSINKCVSSSLQDTGWWQRCGELRGAMFSSGSGYWSVCRMISDLAEQMPSVE